MSALYILKRRDARILALDQAIEKAASDERDACVFCKELLFQEWAAIVGGVIKCEDGAKAFILNTCGVTSRNDLDRSHAAAGLETVPRVVSMEDQVSEADVNKRLSAVIVPLMETAQALRNGARQDWGSDPTHEQLEFDKQIWAEIEAARAAIAESEQAQQAEPVAFEVLMDFGAAVHAECRVMCDVFGDVAHIDLAAIVDRYAAQPPAVAVLDALSKRCYMMSESHLSGYRLILGFERIEDVDAAQAMLAAAQHRWPHPAIDG